MSNWSIDSNSVQSNVGRFSSFESPLGKLNVGSDIGTMALASIRPLTIRPEPWITSSQGSLFGNLSAGSQITNTTSAFVSSASIRSDLFPLPTCESPLNSRNVGSDVGGMALALTRPQKTVVTYRKSDELDSVEISRHSTVNEAINVDHLTVFTTLDQLSLSEESSVQVGVCGILEHSLSMVVLIQSTEITISVSDSHSKRVDDAICLLFGDPCDSEFKPRKTTIRSLLVESYHSLAPRLMCWLGWIIAPAKAMSIKHEESRRYQAGLELIRANQLVGYVATRYDGTAILENGEQVDVNAGTIVKILNSQSRRCKVRWKVGGEQCVGFVASRLVKSKDYLFVLCFGGIAWLAISNFWTY